MKETSINNGTAQIKLAIKEKKAIMLNAKMQGETKLSHTCYIIKSRLWYNTERGLSSVSFASEPVRICSARYKKQITHSL